MVISFVLQTIIISSAFKNKLMCEMLRQRCIVGSFYHWGLSSLSLFTSFQCQIRCMIIIIILVWNIVLYCDVLISGRRGLKWQTDGHIRLLWIHLQLKIGPDNISLPIWLELTPSFWTLLRLSPPFLPFFSSFFTSFPTQTSCPKNPKFHWWTVFLPPAPSVLCVLHPVGLKLM